MRASSSSEPLIYLASFTMDASFDAEYRSWYVRRHVPDVLGLGFWSARAYDDSAESGRIWDIYEIPDADVFTGPGYAAMHASDEGIAEAFRHLTRRETTVYTQIATFSSGRAKSEATSMGSQLLVVLHVASSSSSEEADDRQAQLREHAVSLSSGPGVQTVRLCRHHGKQHPTTPALSPEWMVVVGCGDSTSAQEWAARELSEHRIRGLDGSALDLTPTLLGRWYGVAREDVWPLSGAANA